MMFLLSLDVTMHFRHLRLTHRERAISFLPRKSRCAFERSRNPARRIRFQFTDDLGDRFVLSQFRQDVNVVRSSVNDQRDSLFATNCAAEVLMNSGTDCCRQPELATLCRKDNMIKQIAIGGTHPGTPFRRPLSGALFFLHHTPGVPLCSTPGFSSGAPSGCFHENSPRLFPINSFQRRRQGAAQSSAPVNASLVACHANDTSKFHRYRAVPSVSAPKARRVKARCAAQRNSERIYSCHQAKHHRKRPNQIDGQFVSAPEARWITARSAAERNSGNALSKLSNPCQGVTENGFAANAGYLQDIRI